MFSLKSVILTAACMAALAFSSCKDGETYAEHLEDEKDAISSYLKTNKISVVKTSPDSTTEWLTEEGNLVYYQFSDGLYFHLIEKGDTTTLAPKVGNMVFMRYIGKDMNSDVIYDCSVARTANPECVRLISSPTSDVTFGEGFQKAVRCLYAGGHCKIIVPFKIGNGFNNTVYGTTESDAEKYRPMEYEIWVTRIE